jgi:hypothetical protein
VPKLKTTELVLLDTLVYGLAGKCNNGETLGSVVRRILNTGEYKTLNAASMSAEEWKTTLTQVANNKTLCNYYIASQLSDSDVYAMTIVDDLTLPTDVNVIFEGTHNGDGWEDNGEGSYQTDTEHQLIAKDYIASLDQKYGSKITVSGHSKGGNLSAYVAVTTNRVNRAVSVDGQGFSHSFLDKYAGEINAKSQNILSIDASKDVVSPLLYSIAGKKIYVNAPEQSNLFYYHKPNLLLAEDASLGSMTDRSDFSKQIHEITKEIDKLPDGHKEPAVDSLMLIIRSATEGITPQTTLNFAKSLGALSLKIATSSGLISMLSTLIQTVTNRSEDVEAQNINSSSELNNSVFDDSFLPSANGITNENFSGMNIEGVESIQVRLGDSVKKIGQIIYDVSACLNYAEWIGRNAETFRDKWNKAHKEELKQVILGLQKIETEVARQAEEQTVASAR